MKVSYNWLNNFVDGKLPGPEAVADALTFHAFEIDGIDKVGAGGSAWEGSDAPHDTVLDVKVTANRGHDCLSHRGIAKELSAILKLPLNTQYDPFAKKPDLSKTAAEVSVEIQRTDLCKRYVAGYVKGVKVGPSPEWLRQGLEAIGQRSINNVVDATNLVMFNIGQPLHAFDATKLGSLTMGVRLAKPGEVMLALDKKEYALNESMLVITAGDQAVGIAGVKGGMPAAIDESTTDIVIESANFDGVTVRKTAQALKLRTDASARFEQGISPELAAYGMQQAVDLIKTIAGGEVAGFVDVYPEPQKPQYASVTVEKVNQVLGTSLTGADIADAFQRLGFAYKEEQGVFEVQVPFERLDIEIPEDLVEEVARIVGYDKIPATPLPAPVASPAVNANFYAAEKAREELVAQGYSEVLTSVFAERGERVVLNKVDGVRPYLRESLVPGLTEALAKNKNNKDLLGLKEVKIFEIGTVWKGGKEMVMLGVAGEKGGVSEKPLEPIAAGAYDQLPLSAAARYESFSKYPYIVRDVAAWAPAGTDADALLLQIKDIAGLLANKVMLFDRFEKEGRLSLAYRIIFQSFDRTLTETEANEAMQKVTDSLRAQGFEIR
jgi:phenylalanyl-tRNA synthetase beta subunit